MSLPFPPCRHRREPRSRQVYYCRSEKLAGLRLVTPEVCGTCPYVDHHFPGEADPAAGVHPGMSPEALAALLAGPPRAWPAGWGDWEVTHEAHRLAAERFLAALPPYPSGRCRGRGVVIAGGGAAYFPSLYVTVRALRHVGWEGPVQAWYLGRADELPPARRALLGRHGVECVDADEVRRRHPCRILNGWELKAFAVLHAPFQEVLSLDADCYPVRDPSALFDDPGYRRTGAVFWPDLRDGPPLDERPFGVVPSGRASVESGQFLVDKRLCWRPLQLAWWYNDHSDWSYLHGYGDKHTLEVAWARCGAPYTMFRDDAEWSLHSFKHVGPDGRLLFVHRCKDKFRFGAVEFMNPQAFTANCFHPGLPLEAECFAWLGELGQELGMRLPCNHCRRTVEGRAVGKAAVTIRALLLTSAERRPVWEGTMKRWRATDWGEDPALVVDGGAGPTSTEWRAANPRHLLALAAEQEADYYLFLQDDLLFNLHLRHNLLHWGPLREGWLSMGSLYNPGLTVAEAGDVDLWRAKFFRVPLGAFFGALAVVLSRAAVGAILREWGEEPGAFDLESALIAERHSPGVVMHVPSLVQHGPGPGTGDGAPHRAVDFDPFYYA